MNTQLRQFAEKILIEGLESFTEAQVHLFKQMYSHKNLNLSIEDVVKNMPDDKINWALEQVRRTNEKRSDG